jgi:hypothetical protein
MEMGFPDQIADIFIFPQPSGSLDWEIAIGKNEHQRQILRKIWS